MIESLKVRISLVFLSILIATIYFIPNFIPFQKATWWPSKNKLIYGLDIQGGLHLVLSANVDEVIQTRLFRIKNNLTKKLKAASIDTTSISMSEKSPYPISFILKDSDDLQKTKNLIKQEDESNSIQILRAENSQIVIGFYETRITELKQKAIEQTIEVIRNRIDEFGVSEPLISSQGEDRILVQLPGVKNSEKAKNLIKKTAKLEFAVVNEKFPIEKLATLIRQAEQKGGYSLESKSMTYRKYHRRINRDLKNKLPENHLIVFEKAASATQMKLGKVPYLINMKQTVSGSLLEDASVSFDPDFNRPQVSFKFQPTGQKLFGDLTEKIIGQKLAVVLDNVLKSAPTVQSKIQGQGQISLGQGNYETLLEEANMIATTLRAGALPTHLEQLEEKTVGPTLGQDSINKGKKAGLIGLVLVMIFMLLYYRTLGFVSNICLAMNMFFLLALLSSLSATLTLPGVAGIILTIGMAVDANVIIFERIKEELKKGATLKLAIRDGFGNAFSAILDANITTAIICFVLIYFGTGPIRGFAVTLFCGILTSLFTSVFVSRTLFNFMVLKMGLKKV